MLPPVDVSERTPVPAPPTDTGVDAVILPAEVTVSPVIDAAGVPMARLPVPCPRLICPAVSVRVTAGPTLIEMGPVLLSEPEPVAV